MKYDDPPAADGAIKWFNGECLCVWDSVKGGEKGRDRRTEGVGI